MSSPADELKLAHDSIETSLSGTSYEFSIKAVIAARIGYPIAPVVDRMKRDLINRTPGTWAGMRRNGTTGSGHYWGTYAECIHSSLLQSQEGFLRVFPDWYADRAARFVRLRARGAFLVSSAIDDKGLVGDVKVFSEKGKEAKLLPPWQRLGSVTDANRKAVHYTRDGNIIAFETEAGQTYTVCGEGARSADTTGALE